MNFNPFYANAHILKDGPITLVEIQTNQN